MPKKNRHRKQSEKFSRPSRRDSAFGHSAKTPAPKHQRSSLKPTYPRLTAAIIPVALSLLVNINTLWNGFAVDDQQQVLNSSFIKSLRNLPLAFTSSVWSFGSTDIVFTADSYFRPLFNVLFTINYAFFETSAWGWHLVNIVIHAAVVLFCFVLLKRISGNEWLAAVASSLFAAHPIHAETIAWISGVPDALMSLFLLPAFYFYLRFREEKRRLFGGLALGLFFLALLSKETALAFPLLIFFSELLCFDDGETTKQKFIRGLAHASLFALPVGVYFVMRHHALGYFLSSGGPRYPLGPALKSVPLAFAKYLAFMLMPIRYSYQHFTVPVNTVASVRFLGPLCLVVGVAAAIATRSRLLRLAIIWFIVFLLPALAGLRQFDPEYLVQERYLYVSSIGFCLALAIGLEWLFMNAGIRWHGRKAATVCAAILVVSLGVLHVLQNRVWRDSLAVFTNCVEVDPNSAVAHSSLARVYADKGDLRNAGQEAHKALGLDATLPAAYLTGSYIAFRLNKLDEATSLLEKGLSTIAISPMSRAGVATMQLNLAMLYQQQKDPVRAEAAFRQTVQTLPRPVGWYYTGQFYLSEGKPDEARAMFEEARNHLPATYAPIYLMLGQTYEQMGQPAQARAFYNRFLELAPNDSADRDRVRKHLMSF